MAGAGLRFSRKVPFIKLFFSLATGIVVQWYTQPGQSFWNALLISSFVFSLLFFFAPWFTRFRLAWLSGILAGSLFFSTGGWLAWRGDIRHDPQWLGYHYQETDIMQVTLEEPPVEKTKSMKANASVTALVRDGRSIPVKGNIIIYLKKDTAGPALEYGSTLLIKKPLSEIKNTGNPGGFDFRRYSLFHGITHQLFLRPGEFQVMALKQAPLKKFIYTTREKILEILRTNIKNEKALGLAQALLIGYKNDLDKTLVQSYTNTGVVHIIAISGLHLGLIYGLLLLLTRPIQKNRRLKWLRPILIISGLWLFSLLAGAQPSILRSALMFTCLVLGEVLNRRGSIFNTLALSAFILLCIDPYWLWDTGFQLSYAAVLSIIIFMQPVYNLLYIKNKLLDLIWKMNAVTLAAQVLTLPICIYHFHQFPNYFLLTNIIAVPLSSIILLGEIFLCAIAFIPAAAMFTGRLLGWLIELMNAWVEKLELLPYSIWDGLQISFLQGLFLFLFIAGISSWLFTRQQKGLFIGLTGLVGFLAFRSYSFIESERQNKIIVYNIPGMKAMDIINGRKYLFMGDPGVMKNEQLTNFHLQPSRTMYRVSPASTRNDSPGGTFFLIGKKKVLILDREHHISRVESKPGIDLLIISQDPGIHIPQLAAQLTIQKIVFDASVPSWKLKHWKKDCDSLKISYHDVSKMGAFVMNLR